MEETTRENLDLLQDAAGERSGPERIIITVIGRDRVGIIAGISGTLADCGVNIMDINQTLIREFFTMIMLCDMTGASTDLSELRRRLQAEGERLGVQVTVQREDIFSAMHRI